MTDYEEESTANSMRMVRCPRCSKEFRLRWRDYDEFSYAPKASTLHVRSCPSGGIYDVIVSCPTEGCDHEESL